MAQPAEYTRRKDFTDQDGDDTDHNALNQEFDAAALSINGLRNNLALIQKDDGTLKNGIVGKDQLGSDAFDGFQQELDDAVGRATTAAEESTRSAVASGEFAAVAQSASQSAAQSEENAAASAANAAGAAKALFDGIYLGSLDSDPTADGNGQPLTDGDFYFNNVSKLIRCYDATSGKFVNATPSGQFKRQAFEAGSDFTAGTTTTLTLASDPQTISNIFVHFDAAFQQPSEYSLSGQTLTFTSPIPVGVQSVAIAYLEAVFVPITNAILSFPDYAAATAAAATLPDGQLIVSDADEVRGVVNSGAIAQEQSIYKVADYAKIRSYTGRGTRLRVVDPTGAHWWVRRGAAVDNGGTLLVDAMGRSWEREFSGAINIKWFGAVGGVADDAGAIQAAIDSAAGRPIYAPAGTYKVATGLTYSPAAYDGVFGPGIKIIGDGPFKTYFDNQANGPLLSMTTASTGVLFRGAVGAVLDGFTIKRSVATSNGVGIYMSAAYNPLIRNVHIVGMSSHGIQIPCTLGDNDGSNMVSLEHVRIENCAGWGIKSDGEPGFNETSFIHMRHCFVQACGTSSAGYQPTSGGMAWKGQILTMQQCAFTLNENCALWIPGQAGSAQTVDLQNTTFENNKNRGIFCRGVSMFKARNIQFYNNDAFTSTVACEFEGDSFVVRQIEIDGVVVRSTAGNNAYTAFKLSGANTDFNSCRVRNVSWDNFDYAGQTRFSGWQFDQIPSDAYILQVASSAEVYVRPNTYIGKGNKIPLRLRGGIGGSPSTTGEWVAHQLSSAGIYFNPASLPVIAGTRYWLYLYDNNGVPTLEASSTSGPTTDTASGYAVKSGDSTKYYVGSILGGATNGTVATTGTGWLNPTVVANGASNSFAYTWVSSAGVLRIKSSGALPTSDTDGFVVGGQA